MKLITTLVTGVLCAAAPLAAQQSQETPPTPASPVLDAFENWKDAHGTGWLLRTDHQTGTAYYLFGGRVEPQFQPRNDVEWFELGRQAFASTFGMFRAHDTVLEDHDVLHADLSRIGTSDKVGVKFRHVHRGIPVVHGWANAIFDADGWLLAVDFTGVPDVHELNTTPVLDEFEAIHYAGIEYGELAGYEPTEIDRAELVIYPHVDGKTRVARLAWSVRYFTDVPGAGLDTGHRIYVAADTGLGEILGNDNLVHTAAPQNLQGHVDAWASPGTRPDISSNPETLHSMKFMDVTSSAGNDTTDANGDFDIGNAGGNPVDVTFRFRGPYANVLDSAGAEYTLTESITPGTFANVEMNPGKTANVTAEANAYRCIIDFYDYKEKWLPADNKVSFPIVANVNLSSTCNAFFNGNSINHYSAGGGCNNTAYSTVVAHEEGHWANVLYSSGNGSDGFGEGNADNYATYIYDNPIVGEFFTTGGGFIRTGNNTRQFCGDNNTGCYGQVHADGEVLMGACWKVRRNLKSTLGNQAGSDVADGLFTQWMSLYNDGQIRTVIEDHWLTIDDNDGNIFNGTPNYTDIDGGFREQGFPGVDLQLIQIVHTPLPEVTQNEAGPYTVDATITSLVGSTITGAEVKYEVNGGATQTLAMSNTAGNDWSADIPGQASVAFVDYWIEASDAIGNTQSLPREGNFGFTVGVVQQIHFDDFEAATSNWTNGLVPNGQTNQNDWQHDAPNGLSTDPASAFSGTKVWANDVGNSGWNGEYQPNVHNYLESPAFDLSGKTGVRVKFMRQIGIEEQNAPFGSGGHYDRAQFLVNGSIVWENPINGDVIDGAWTEIDYDIGSLANNNSSVTFRFELNSDGGLQYGGWTIDDFEIYSVEPVPGGGNAIVLSGPATANTGQTVTYSMSNMPANANWWIAWSKNLNGTVVNGHPFDLGAPYTIAGSGTADPAGNGSFTSGVIPAAAAGQTFYVEVGAVDAGQLSDSNALQLDVN